MMKRSIILAAFLLSTAFNGKVQAQELSLNGFVEGAYGGRVQDNRFVKKDYLLNEVRLQLQMSQSTDLADFFSSIDFVADNVVDDNTGLDIREAYFRFSPFGFLDVKAGRQVLTWGTGDLVFINDLFPKDYISFFTGREDQYLKLPSDALKLGIFTSGLNFDLVIVPKFQNDQLPTGDRLSFFNPLAGDISGRDDNMATESPKEKFGNSELAVRAYKMVNNFSIAGYYYRGFYKSPQGITNNFNLYYPDLSVYGASLRGAALDGVLSLEYGYYDSREETGGQNPFIPNSSHRYLLGYEAQFWTDFTIGAQYYGEKMMNYDNYLLSLPSGTPKFDEFRHVFTTRLTKLAYYQNITMSLFTFFSPSDEDFHIRPNVSFKYSDEVTLSAGANLFAGNKSHSLFGQFEDNNNMYMRLRYYF